MLKMFAYGALQKGGYMRSPGLNDQWLKHIMKISWFHIVAVVWLWPPSANLLDMLVVGVSLVSIIFSDRCPIFTCPSLTIFPCPFRCPSLLVHVIDHLCLPIFDLPNFTSPSLWPSLLVQCPCPWRPPQRWSSVRLEDLACVSCPQTSSSNSESQGAENCHSGGFSFNQNCQEEGGGLGSIPHACRKNMLHIFDKGKGVFSLESYPREFGFLQQYHFNGIQERKKERTNFRDIN